MGRTKLEGSHLSLCRFALENPLVFGVSVQRTAMIVLKLSRPVLKIRDFPKFHLDQKKNSRFNASESRKGILSQKKTKICNLRKDSQESD